MNHEGHRGELASSNSGSVCPGDGQPMDSVATDQGQVEVCLYCHGMWLWPATVQRLATDVAASGWVGYLPLTVSPHRNAACVLDATPMYAFLAVPESVVHRCSRCHGIWFPGDTLLSLHERARRRAGNDETFPITEADGFRLGAAAIRVGIDPRVVEELLVSMSDIWQC